MTLKTFSAATVEMDVKSADKKENMRIVSSLVDMAVRHGAELVCLPEYALTGPVPSEFANLSESIPGPSTENVGKVAMEHGLHLVFSMPEKYDGQIYNTAVLVGPNGDVLGTHRKMHLFLDENGPVANGSEYTVVDTVFGRIGLMVCYDLAFPELSRGLALRGAEILVAPSNWPEPFQHQWDIATRARALDNQVWIIAANRLGKVDRYSYFGDSRIVNPFGLVTEHRGERGVSVSLLEAEASPGFRRIVNFLGDRRDSYGL